MCKICGNKTTKMIINNNKYDKCLKCGFLQKDNILFLNSDMEKRRYTYHHNDSNSDYVLYQKSFYQKIKQYVEGKTLDFGCGDNHILANIISSDFETYYYDLYFYPDLEYKNRKYKTIIMEEVIEHLKEPLEVLLELVNLLCIGGKLIIETNFIPDDVKSQNWWYLRDVTHISFFEKKTFLYLCDFLGLKCIYCNDVNLIILEKV